MSTFTSPRRWRAPLAVAAAAALVAVAVPAFAADTIFPDGDTASNAPNIAYGGGGRDCAARGESVPGSIRVSFNGGGSQHFDQGEALTVSFSAPAGVTVQPGAVPDVPTDWGTTQQDAFTIPFSTTVSPSSAGGKVEVTVTGQSSGYSAGADEGSGRPQYIVNVSCPVPADTTPPLISYTLTPPTPNGSNGWWVSPIGVDWTVTDPESAITSTTGCDDTSVATDTAGVQLTCTATSAGGTSSLTTESIKLDSHGPTLDHPNATIDVCGAGKPAMTWSDNLSGVDPATVTAGSWSQSGSGLGATFTYTGSAADLAGNLTAGATQTYTATTYGSAYSGVLQPVNADGSSRFKLGSTIPVKFRLTCGGTPISNATARLRVSQGDTAPDAGTDEAVSTASSTTGNLFRYDTTDQQYIFNLSTKTAYGNPDGSKISSFTQGTWTLAIVLDDGVAHNVKIQLVR